MALPPRRGHSYTANFQSIKALASNHMIVPIAKCEFPLLHPRKRLSLLDQFGTDDTTFAFKDNTTSAFDEKMCFYRLFLAGQQWNAPHLYPFQPQYCHSRTGK